MQALTDREVLVGRRRYRIAVYALPSRARYRAEASQAGRVVESIDAAGQLAARIGINRRLRRTRHNA